ncbi:MAG TPA: hypothetical protein PKK10_09255 [Woeseiaceae bacterium]|nr:hypothetical protein [Woeseiaceae bacterium]
MKLASSIMRTGQVLILALALPVLAGCPDSAIYVTKEIAPGMLIDAKIDTSARRFRAGEVKVAGTILIENRLDEAIRYSNERLWLNVNNELSRRTHVDSLASHAVDVGFVEIPPGENLYLSVYWVLPEEIGRSLDERSVDLELAIP